MDKNAISFSRFHPAALFFYFLSLILFTVFAQNPVMLARALLGGALFCADFIELFNWGERIGIVGISISDQIDAVIREGKE